MLEVPQHFQIEGSALTLGGKVAACHHPVCACKEQEWLEAP